MLSVLTNMGCFIADSRVYPKLWNIRTLESIPTSKCLNDFIVTRPASNILFFQITIEERNVLRQNATNSNEASEFQTQTRCKSVSIVPKEMSCTKSITDLFFQI